VARTASITPQLIEYLRWTRWDGKLPLFTGGQSPLVTVPLDSITSAPSGGSPTPAPSPTPGTRPPAQPSPAPGG
jgi:hypothetical protein